jgi:hypothetical protein
METIMQQVIRFESTDVTTRLKQLGLDQMDLQEPIMQGKLARSESTPKDPPLSEGFTTWSRTVRVLREKLIPKHWTRSDEGNYSLVVNPTGDLAIAVATGDESTGISIANPMTKSPKGSRTQSAIEVNQYQSSLFEGFPEFEIPETPHNDRVTWILLQHYDQGKKEVRFELSRPSNYSGKVDGWSERLIMSALPFDPTTAIPVPVLPNLPDVDIPLIRRA